MANKSFASPPYHGAAWYPELWPESVQEEDIRLFLEMGFNVARMGEFAWSKMEQKEGEFDFSFFQNTVDKLFKAGIATLLCTPTATPPQWLSDRYPEILSVSAMGVRAQHGARRHACPNNPVMRAKNKELVTRMAAAFSGRPGVLGWQIDNEINPNQGCFCPHCKAGFARFLEARFGTVEALNAAWGADRWSLTFTSFAAVPPPRPDTWNHPSLEAAYREYQSDSWAAFAREQADILHAAGEQNIGTDLAPYMGIDFAEINKPMDVAMINHYDDVASLPAGTAWLDAARGLKPRPFYSTETLPNYNGNTAATPLRPEGFCYANGWLAFLCGADMSLYWHFRGHRNGHELYHGAVVTPFGTLAPRSGELKRVSCELKAAWPFLEQAPVAPHAALHITESAARQFAVSPVAWGFTYRPAVMDTFYLPLTKQARFTVDIIELSQSLQEYPLVFSPYLRCAEEHGFPQRILDFVERGGTWVAGPLTDINDRNISLYHRPYGFLEELAGVKCLDLVPCTTPEAVAFADGSPAALIGPSEEYLEPVGAETLLQYTGGCYTGLAAATCRTLGKGRVVLLGAAPTAETLMELLQRLGYAPPYPGNDNVAVYNRRGAKKGLAAVELCGREGYLQLQQQYIDHITRETLIGRVPFAPYQVRVLEEIG